MIASRLSSAESLGDGDAVGFAHFPNLISLDPGEIAGVLLGQTRFLVIDTVPRASTALAIVVDEALREIGRERSAGRAAADALAECGLGLVVKGRHLCVLLADSQVRNIFLMCG